MWNYSRGAGFVYIFLAAVGAACCSRKRMIVVIVSFLIGGWLSWIGFTERGTLNPGLANFMTSMFAPQNVSDAAGSGLVLVDPALNPLNALDAWTAAVWAGGALVPSSLVERWFLLAEVVQPLPSEFVRNVTKVGDELARVFGTWGTTDFTTPALAELYLLFGDGAALGVGCVGVGAAVIDRFVAGKRHWLSVLAFIAIVYGFIIQTHSGLRAATRPIVYVAFIAVLRKMIALVGRRRRIEWPIGKSRRVVVGTERSVLEGRTGS